MFALKNVKFVHLPGTPHTTSSPQIQILKRCRNKDTERDLHKPSTEADLKKALKLREAQYQAARNRILGTSLKFPHPPEASLTFPDMIKHF